MSDLISREALMQFPYSPESGTDDMIENWITEAGLCGESVDFDEGIAEKARELCKLVIKGFVNIVETEPSAYDVEAVVEKLEENGQKMSEAKAIRPYAKHSPADHRYYKAISVKKAVEIVRSGGKE